MRSHFVNANHIEIVGIGFQKLILVTFLSIYLENKIPVPNFFIIPHPQISKEIKCLTIFCFLQDRSLYLRTNCDVSWFPKVRKKKNPFTPSSSYPS